MVGIDPAPNRTLREGWVCGAFSPFRVGFGHDVPAPSCLRCDYGKRHKLFGNLWLSARFALAFL